MKALFGKVLLIEHGYLAVDGFFVLTGYLIAQPLIRQSKDASFEGLKWGDKLAKYFTSRFVRINLPLLLLAVLHCWVVNGSGTYRRDSVRLEPARKVFDVLFGSSEVRGERAVGGARGRAKCWSWWLKCWSWWLWALFR